MSKSRRTEKTSAERSREARREDEIDRRRGRDEEDPNRVTAPAAIIALQTLTTMALDPDDAAIRAAIAVLPPLAVVAQHVPRDFDPEAKRNLVRVIQDPNASLADTAIVPLGQLVLIVAAPLFAKADLGNYSQVQPVVQPFLQAMQELRLPPPLMATADVTRGPPGLNASLDAMRLAAIKLAPPAAIDVWMAKAPRPTDTLATAGVRFPLAAVLAPCLAAALTARTNTRVSVMDAHAILFGDKHALRSLENKQ